LNELLRSLESLPLLFKIRIFRLEFLLLLLKFLVGGVEFLRFLQQNLVLFDDSALRGDLILQDFVLLREVLTQGGIIHGRIVGVRRQYCVCGCGGGVAALAESWYGRERQQKGTCRK
jgi:hypothetical protein